MSPRRRWLAIPVLIALIALIVGACGSGDSDGEEGGDVPAAEALTDEERAYLEAAGAAETLRGDAAEEANDALGQSYAVPSQLLRVFERAGFVAAGARAHLFIGSPVRGR